MNRSAQFYQVTFGGVSNVLSKKKKRKRNRGLEGRRGGREERSSIMRHPPPSSTLFSGLCLVLQGTKLLRGTTVLLSEYFRALKMLQSVKVWKLFYRKVEDWSIPSHFLSSLGSQLRRYWNQLLCSLIPYSKGSQVWGLDQQHLHNLGMW